MKMKTNMKISGTMALAVGSLLILPSCGFVDWVKEKFGGSKQEPMSQPTESSQSMKTISLVVPKDDNSPVLATIEGEPLITKNMLDEEKKKLIEANPQLEAVISLMDEKQLDRNLMEGILSREVIRKYVKDNKIDQSERFQKDYQMAMSQIGDLLNTRYFMESFSVSVNDAEIKKFYDDNKDVVPNLLVSRGGVTSVGIPFANEQKARDFMVKVRASNNDIQAAAKELNVTDKVKDFRSVNTESLGIEPALRDKIAAIKSVPSLHTFKAGNEYWVVAATKREEPKYRELDQVRGEIKQMLEKEKTMKKVEDEVARLKEEYRIDFNKEFFAPVDNQKAVQARAEIPKEEMKKAVKDKVAAAAKQEEKKPVSTATKVA